MKLTLCALNSKFIHSTLAVWYLYSSVKEKCVCSVVEGTINEEFKTLLERIEKSKSDIVAFSTYVWNKALVIKLAKEVKSKVIAKAMRFFKGPAGRKIIILGYSLSQKIYGFN